MMSIYGDNTWYSGELRPNNFGSQPYQKQVRQQAQSGLPDAFYGANMGLPSPPTSPLGHPGWPTESLNWNHKHGVEGATKLLGGFAIFLGAWWLLGPIVRGRGR